MNYPTADEICTIATDDTRSFADEADEIAHQYHRLAEAMAERLGRHDLNWCGFAKWSSKAIGESLRLDRSSFWNAARDAFGVHWVFGGPFRVVMRTLLGGAYGNGLSVANRSIFLEMGTFYTNLLTDSGTLAMCQNRALRTQQIDHPLLGELTEEQKDHLLDAARLFRDAESATGTERSHLVLAANIALSAHEQCRVQGVLEYVLYRPVRWTTRVSWRIPWCRLTGGDLPRFKFYTEAHDAQPALTRRLEALWSRGYVRALGLTIPGGRVLVGRPLVRPPDPPSPLLDTDLNDRAAEMVARFHPDRAKRLDGVRDWLDYAERMRFIVSYFMMYQNDEDMFFEPFPDRRPRVG